MVKTIKVSAKDNWKYEFTNLDKFKDGKEIVYTVSEDNVDSYKASYDGFNITNTHEIIKTSVKGTKTWNDNDNQDGLRPEKITVKLLADGEVVSTKEVSAEDNWTYEFTDLDKFKDGKEIVYTISEEAVEGYTGTIDGFNITNKHTPVTISIPVVKSWVDGNNQDGLRPDKVTINLLADGEVVKTAEVTAKDNWKYEFTGLDKFKNGKEIVYTLSEEKVEGYEVSYDGFNVVNTHNPSKTLISGVKTWNDDNNNDGIRPDSITVRISGKVLDKEVYSDYKVVTASSDWKYSFENLPEYNDGKLINYTISEDDVKGYSTSYDGFNITNTHESEKVSIEGVKTWNDNNNQDGIRPEKITINLLADGEVIDSTFASSDTDWKYSFENINKYKNGKEIKYSLSEVDVEGYESDTLGFDIVNSHTPEVINFKAIKVWDDENNNDGIRPDSINVTLIGKVDGETIYSSAQTISVDNNWTYVFENLPKYNNGTLIEYVIIEDVVNGYVNSSLKSTTLDNNVTTVIINTHVPEKTDIEVNKTWVDDNSSSRPDTIYVDLVGEVQGTEVYHETVEITKDDDWTHIFENLYKYKDGKVIDYSISEKSVDGYTTSYDSFNIINTLNKKYENIEVIPPQTGNDDTIPYIYLLLGTLSLGIFLRKAL